MKKWYLLLLAVLLLGLSARLVFSVPAGSPPGTNRPDAAFNSVSFPDSTDSTATTKLKSAYGAFYNTLSSTLTANAGNTGSYLTSRNKCSNKIPGSHVCNFQEIVNSYEFYNSTVNSLTDSYWINNGPPAYITDLSNDCQGWTSNASTVFGSVWNFTSKKAMMTPCNQLRKFACCN
jgi:hypothetical protein